MAFYENCIDCKELTGEDMRNKEGVCWSCQRRYRDEDYARTINTAIDADLDKNVIFWQHMAEVMKLCYKLHDLEEEVKKIPFDISRPIMWCPPQQSDINYFKSKLDYHLDVADAVAQLS
jgi:hypothetical protein